MTSHGYTFGPLLVDASPIPSRFAAPLDSGGRRRVACWRTVA